MLMNAIYTYDRHCMGVCTKEGIFNSATQKNKFMYYEVNTLQLELHKLKLEFSKSLTQNLTICRNIFNITIRDMVWLLFLQVF